jgi:hypothetical protein
MSPDHLENRMGDITSKNTQSVAPSNELMNPIKNPVLLAFVLKDQMKTNPNAVHDFFNRLEELI